MLRDSRKVELVASLSRLFFLRHFDPRDARYDLQRVYILVSIFIYSITFDYTFETSNVKYYRWNKNVSGWNLSSC